MIIILRKRYLGMGLFALFLIVLVTLVRRTLPPRQPQTYQDEEPHLEAAHEPRPQIPIPFTEAGVPSLEEIPWLMSPDFSRAQEVHNTPVLLTAFRAVLRDPIAGEEHNIALATRRLSGVTVASGAVFSLNRTLGPYTAANGFVAGPNYVGNRLVLGTGGGVCKIATMLYNLTILGNLAVVHRKPHTMIVPYVPPGQDATVSYSAWVDYSFRNTTPDPILIWGEKVGDALYLAFYGRRKGPRVTWGHEILSHTPAPLIRRYNPHLSQGEEREITPGFDGYIVRSWAEVSYPNGRTEIRPLGTTAYAVGARVVEYGTPMQQQRTRR